MRSVQKGSDRCTRFFHDLVKRNNKRNSIVAITKRSGEHTTSLSEAEFVDYFQSLLGQPVQCSPLDSTLLMGQQLTDGQRQELINVVTAEEIRAALFDIGSDKAPGPDGYGAKFFTSAWGVLINRARCPACCAGILCDWPVAKTMESHANCIGSQVGSLSASNRLQAYLLLHGNIQGDLEDLGQPNGKGDGQIVGSSSSRLCS